MPRPCGDPAFAIDVHRTLGLLRRGPHDPCFQVSGDGAVWRTTKMASGAAAYRLVQHGPREVRCDAWGDGASEVVTQLPELLGAADDQSEFDPRLPLVARRSSGIRGSASRVRPGCWSRCCQRCSSSG
ncbi:MAG: hypothetical protein WKF83_01940 [Nocardioidaceae bacterium]